MNKRLNYAQNSITELPNQYSESCYNEQFHHEPDPKIAPLLRILALIVAGVKTRKIYSPNTIVAVK